MLSDVKEWYYLAIYTNIKINLNLKERCISFLSAAVPATTFCVLFFPGLTAKTEIYLTLDLIFMYLNAGKGFPGYIPNEGEVKSVEQDWTHWCTSRRQVNTQVGWIASLSLLPTIAWISRILKCSNSFPSKHWWEGFGRKSLIFTTNQWWLSVPCPSVFGCSFFPVYITGNAAVIATHRCITSHCCSLVVSSHNVNIPFVCDKAIQTGMDLGFPFKDQYVIMWFLGQSATEAAICSLCNGNSIVSVSLTVL